MGVHCDIIVQGSTVVFTPTSDTMLISSDPQDLRETLENHMDLEAIDDSETIGTVTFPTTPDGSGNTSFSIHDEYKQHSVLF